MLFRRRLRLQVLSAVLAVTFILLLSPPQSASALNYTVNTLADTNDATCDAANCTLREAINAANATAANDTIDFSVSGSIVLTSTLPNLASTATAGTLTINAGGTITVSGGSAVRVFIILSGANVTLNSLTIANANATGSGGGISNSGTLTVNNSTFSDNSASGGGGIYNSLGATLTVMNSTFSGNAAGGGSGGGILNNGTVTVSNSTFSGNSAGNGGAIANFGGTGVTVTNSTISGNSGSNGGGIFTQPSTSPFTLNNTIIANSVTGGDCFRSGSGIVNARNSLIEGGLTCVNGTNTNNLTGDPNLATLTGSPAYFPLNTGSIAIDAGLNSLATAAGLTTDQAGNPRFNGTVDMGAVEYAAASLNVTLALQGRPLAPNNAYVTTVHVQVRLPGSTTPISSQDYVSNSSGQFTISGLTNAAYDIRIKGTHTLAVVDSVTLDAGVNPLTTTALPEGDANDNNTIVLDDFSLLAAAFGTTSGHPNFNPQADFNGDGQIQLTDFSLLASNFNQAGAP